MDVDTVLFFSQTAAQYQAEIANDPFWQEYHARRFATFNALIPEGRHRLFDVGCGSGENLVTVSRLGHQVSGNDPAPEMVKLAKAHLREHGLEPTSVTCGDVHALNAYPIGAFDVVTALNVLPYLTDDDEDVFYRESRRLITDHGAILVSHRNELVDAITFNRYTVDFWRTRIIPKLTDRVEDQQALLAHLSRHLAYPDRPLQQGLRLYERDFLHKRRVNPIDYPIRLRERYGLTADRVAFTHFWPLPPQFMESSHEYRHLIFAFEDQMKEDPLRYLFASIMMLRLRKV
jgi:2-polyprenyl-3-methyl-5-hydroxy-6-metoxy-1,4-benzoquinol methylase